MISFPLWPTLYWLGLAACFYYFLLAGARTFQHGPGDERSAFVAGLSFGGAMLAVMALGFRAALPWPNAVAGAVLMAAAQALYEWARRTVRARKFRIAWSGDVPDAVCRDGPYRLVRHPVYASYMIAFASLFAVLPGWTTLGLLLGNIALFVHAARDDERSLLASDLGADYRAYRERTGMFFPRSRTNPAAGE